MTHLGCDLSGACLVAGPGNLRTSVAHCILRPRCSSTDFPKYLQSKAFADLSEGCAVRIVQREAARNLGPEDPVFCREVLVADP